MMIDNKNFELEDDLLDTVTGGSGAPLANPNIFAQPDSSGSRGSSGIRGSSGSSAPLANSNININPGITKSDIANSRSALVNPAGGSVLSGGTISGGKTSAGGGGIYIPAAGLMDPNETIGN